MDVIARSSSANAHARVEPSRAVSASRLWLGAVALPVAAAGMVLSATGGLLDMPRLSAFERNLTAARVFLLVSAVAVVLAPLAGVWWTSRSRDTAAERRQPARSGVAVDTWAIAGPLAGGAALLSVTMAAIGYALAPGTSDTLWRSHAVLWAGVLALAALGSCAAAAFDHPLDAAAVAIGAALALSVGVFIAGPAVERVPGPLLSTVLIASPVIAGAASARIDLFRTDPLYQVSPLAHMRVDYPSPGDAFTWNVIFALLLFVGTACYLRRDRLYSVERMSA